MKEKQKDIIIANPMYDVVFKLLMMSDKNIAGISWEQFWTKK